MCVRFPVRGKKWKRNVPLYSASNCISNYFFFVLTWYTEETILRVRSRWRAESVWYNARRTFASFAAEVLGESDAALEDSQLEFVTTEAWHNHHTVLWRLVRLRHSTANQINQSHKQSISTVISTVRLPPQLLFCCAHWWTPWVFNL